MKTEHGKLVKEILAIAKQDTVNTYGSRSLVNGPLHQLEGYEMNPVITLQDALNKQVVIEVNNKTDKVHITFPAGKANQLVKAPVGATHFEWYVVVAVYDLIEMSAAVQVVSTGLLPYKAVTVRQQKRSVDFDRAKGQVLMVAVGVKWNCNCPAPLIMAKVQKC